MNAFVQRMQPDLSSWLEASVAFPCSTVYRIVPAVTDEDLECLSDKLGAFDAGAVFTEPFSQWVIEDNFASQRPRWEEVGALLVADVSPFEDLKLRLLNGSHSLIAYLGVLAGYDFVQEVMANLKLQRLVRQFMDTVTQTLTIPAGFDVEQYKSQLCTRFANSSLRHKTAQIAMDGSQKIPQRWLPPCEKYCSRVVTNRYLLWHLRAGFETWAAKLTAVSSTLLTTLFQRLCSNFCRTNRLAPPFWAINLSLATWRLSSPILSSR